MEKAKIDLEELYSGIPDDSVNLTFQDLAEVQQNIKATEKKKSPSSSLSSTAIAIKEPIQEAQTPPSSRPPPPSKLPSLDFNAGLQASRTHPLEDHDRGVVVYGDHYQSHRDHRVSWHNQPNHLHQNVQGINIDDGSHSPHHHHVYGNGRDHRQNSSHRHRQESDDQVDTKSYDDFRYALEKSMPYADHDVSGMSMASPYPAGKSRRPGIPHSNICTICCTYTYIFRHRCLVCGRAYCRNCVFVGMGEMKEGRKCIDCLGRKFSQRYIQRAGQVGCCSRYPGSVKQAELKWAEKGPRRTNERGYSISPMGSRSLSPVTPRMPARAHRAPNETPSFVSNTPYSPYSPAYRHRIPL